MTVYKWKYAKGGFYKEKKWIPLTNLCQYKDPWVSSVGIQFLASLTKQFIAV